MKFTDGFWSVKEGFQTFSPIQVRDIKKDEKSVTAFASTNHVNQRGDTLNQPMITVKLSSLRSEVIRVQIYHFKGIKSQSPVFELNEQDNSCIETFENKNEIGIKSGNLSAKITKDNWSLDFYNGTKHITGSDSRRISYIIDNNNLVFMREQLSLGVGECVYGLGERFTPFVKNGQVIDMWNEDGGTCSEIAYKNIPFYITNKGYGVLVNHSEKVSFEVASENVSRVQFSVPGEYLEYFIIGGTSIKSVLENYTSLTGKPALPPAWTFGLWLTTSFTTSYDEKTVTSFIDGMIQRDIPLSVFHFDCFWMKEYQWCDFEWDKDVFPDPINMLKRYKEKGLKICVWINPYIAQKSILFDEGMEHGYLIKKADGDIWQTDKWQAGMGIVDFTNPEACNWYKSKLKALIDMGVDCFKTDFGERIPTEVVYYDGSDPIKMHNFYTFLYNKLVFETLKESYGAGNAAVFARSATVGGQQFPVHWGGDSTGYYESMAESLRGGLSLSLSGFGFWSHDIGGFEKTATADVYKRWVAFGLLSTHSRLHGSSSYRVPWLFDEEAVDVLRYFTKLKCSLMPYLFNRAIETSIKGIPMMRAMIIEFNDDPSCDYLDRQFMLGDSLLVAPVFNKEGNVSYYLPKGTWTNFLTNDKIKGGHFVNECHGFMSIPLMVRENSIIAIGKENDKPDYDFADNVTLHVFELQEGCNTNVEVNNLNGNVELNVHANRNGNLITFEAIKYKKAWKVILRGVYSINAVMGGRYEKHELGTMIIADDSSSKIEVKLK